MVESDLPLVDLICLWESHEDGTTLTCTLTLEMGQTLPGSIWKEIEVELIARFMGAIEARLDQLAGA